MRHAYAGRGCGVCLGYIIGGVFEGWKKNKADPKDWWETMMKTAP